MISYYPIVFMRILKPISWISYDKLTNLQMYLRFFNGVKISKGNTWKNTILAKIIKFRGVKG